MDYCLLRSSHRAHKTKGKIWRGFKKIGALYLQMSLCDLPNNKENKEKFEEISKLMLDNGKLIKITTNEYDEKEHNKMLDLFREERNKQ